MVLPVTVHEGGELGIELSDSDAPTLLLTERTGTQLSSAHCLVHSFSSLATPLPSQALVYVHFYPLRSTYSSIMPLIS